MRSVAFAHAWAWLVAMVIAASGCRSAQPDLFPPQIAAPGQPTHTIYVTANRWHSGLVLPNRGLLPPLDDAINPWREELRRRGQASPQWHEFGWGDDAYYRAPAGTETSGMTLRAMLWPTRSVNHVWSLPESPPAYFQSWQIALFEIELSEAGYQRLTDHLLSYFDTDEHGRPTVAVFTPGVYGVWSGFFAAHPKRRYSLLHNCNHMVADTLAAAGLPITAIYAVHSINIEHQLDRAAKKYDAVTRLQARHPAE